MLSGAAAERRIGPSLTFQVMALLVGGLLVAQVVTVVLVAVLPPPRPPIYRLSEIAAALRGGPVDTRYGRRLVRRTQSAPPAFTRGRPDDAGRDELAALLGGDQEVVYRRSQGPDPLAVAVFSNWGPPPMVDGPTGQKRTGYPHGASWSFGRGARTGGTSPQQVVLGEFSAAWRSSPGQWVVVTPAPDVSPNGWQRRVLLWLTATLIIILPIGYLFARRITAPLAAFAQAADRFGRDPSAPSLLLEGPAEVGVAARAFNEMQSRLKRYVDDRTAMVGAISHDLRTPLARIRFRVERSAPELRSAVVADIAQMESMIDAVLQFIRDASSRPMSQHVDLLSVLESVVDDAVSTGGPAAIVSEFHAIVRGDSAGLQRLFANLVDNAVKYGGCAKVVMRAQDGDIVVDIADEGPGLPASELQRVFEPFYRAEASRTLDDRGIGLGLAIARAIAREHGGDVQLISEPAGLTARVLLPRDEPARVRTEDARVSKPKPTAKAGGRPAFTLPSRPSPGRRP